MFNWFPLPSKQQIILVIEYLKVVNYMIIRKGKEDCKCSEGEA